MIWKARSFERLTFRLNWVFSHTVTMILLQSIIQLVSLQAF